MRWFKVFVPDGDKVLKLVEVLKNGYLNMPDNLRNDFCIKRILFSYFFVPNVAQHVFYEIGDFQGLLGFTNIVKGHKADVNFKMWDSDIWCPSLVKESKKVFDYIMTELQLVRLSAETPDLRVKRLAEIVGFKEEGIKDKDFMFDGKLFDTFQLGILGG